MRSRSLMFPQASVEPSLLPLLSKGFRPFFLLGALLAALSVPLWLLALSGGFQPGGAFGAMQWHAHEMLFGFSSAVIAGFLLTAASNWTGRETAVGLPLAGLAGLWLLGRVGLFFAGALPRWAPALLDLGFLPGLAYACARPIFATQNRRNYGFVALLLALFIANVVTHYGALQGNFQFVRSAHRVAVDVICLMIAIVSGRVVPMFTRGVYPSEPLRAWPALERAAGFGLILILLSDAFALNESIIGALAAVTGLLTLVRMRHWGTRHSLREPLLWVLHLGALWLPVGLLLRACAAFFPSVPAASGLHALTAGAIGTLTLGMMARVSLGHTGRPLRAPALATAAFGLVVSAALLRVLSPFWPSVYLQTLTLAGTLWSAAFISFVLGYARILLSRRADAH